MARFEELEEELWHALEVVVEREQPQAGLSPVRAAEANVYCSSSAEAGMRPAPAQTAVASASASDGTARSVSSSSAGLDWCCAAIKE